MDKEFLTEASRLFYPRVLSSEKKAEKKEEQQLVELIIFFYNLGTRDIDQLLFYIVEKEWEKITIKFWAWEKILLQKKLRKLIENWR